MRKVFFAAASAFALIAAGCTTEDKSTANGIVNGKTASLVITIEGKNPSSRAVGQASTPNNPPVEDVVSNMTVFVFNNANGELEKKETFDLTDGQYTKQITGLSTGSLKLIVAYVNVPTGVNFGSIKDYFALEANSITLESQYAADVNDVGLFMSGSASQVLLSSTDTNTVTIPVSRLVAKVFIQSLKIVPADDAYIEYFDISGAAVQLARYAGMPVENNVLYEGGALEDEYLGGIATETVPNTLEGLYQNISYDFTGYTPGTDLIASTDEEIYFYVMPDTSADSIETLMTIHGIYGRYIPTNAYFPFVINNGELAANYKYGLNITLKKLHMASADPNIVPQESVLEVTVTPQDWYSTVTQNVEW